MSSQSSSDPRRRFLRSVRLEDERRFRTSPRK
jgi:hypothetical protein